MLKRSFDLLVSAYLLLISLPVFLLIALAIKLDSRGAVFYVQKRIGQYGRLFKIFKFRSMVPHADRIGGHSTAPNDARITRTGKFLRKTSLDEIPQLINVLIGDMSLIGPRPDVPAQEADYTPEDWQQRCRVKPGITGLAQATLRSDATPEERTRLDLDYADRQSFLLDMRILLMTIRQVLGRGGF